MSSERTKLFDDIPASAAEEIDGGSKLWKLLNEKRRENIPTARFVPDTSRSVVVVGVGTATMRMEAEAQKIKLTGIAKDWTIKVEQNSSFEWTLFLNWVTPDRNTGEPLHLVYRETRSYSAIPSLIEWVHYALRYVFQHEADETILLTDGTRPFDPHT